MNKSKISPLYKNKAWLEEAYYKNKSVYKIAKLCNVKSQVTIYNWLVKFNIKTISMVGRCHSDATKKKMSCWSKGKTPMKGKKHSYETRRMMSINRTGNKNCNWKGGLTVNVKSFRQSKEYQRWRRSVLIRDNYICQIFECYKFSNIAHHVESLKDRPDLKLEVSNGKTVCIGHHSTIHKKKGYNYEFKLQ